MNACRNWSHSWSAKCRPAGIGSASYYPLSLHLQTCFKDLGGKEGDFPLSEQASREVLALPIYPELPEEQVKYVAETLRKIAG